MGSVLYSFILLIVNKLLDYPQLKRLMLIEGFNEMDEEYV
jgi:hypothetical protein